ncbi:MAG: hypothetical protein K940chlam1_01253 [Candidatus Anoxychlamydiales bacterium]|nr:hypothetical protein [Candidatus Anoxychlamydiales bacterium]NGX35828.1 hypothetical protein [Candidatus Anoxychlamydiales bacterium]
MDFNAIKTAVASTAQQAKNIVVEKGSVYATWAGRQVKNIGGVLKSTALAVMNWMRGFLKNFPQYFATAKQYFNVGINYIRNHQYPVAVGAGIAAAATLVIYGLAKYLGGE